MTLRGHAEAAGGHAPRGAAPAAAKGWRGLGGAETQPPHARGPTRAHALRLHGGPALQLTLMLAARAEVKEVAPM